MKSICQTLNGPLGSLKMSGSNTNSLPWVVLWTNGTSEVGTFCGLVNLSPPILIHEGYCFCQEINGLTYVQ